jgi:hypothetical protein
VCVFRRLALRQRLTWHRTCYQRPSPTKYRWFPWSARFPVELVGLCQYYESPLPRVRSGETQSRRPCNPLQSSTFLNLPILNADFNLDFIQILSAAVLSVHPPAKISRQDRIQDSSARLTERKNTGSPWFTAHIVRTFGNLDAPVWSRAARKVELSSTKPFAGKIKYEISFIIMCRIDRNMTGKITTMC